MTHPLKGKKQSAEHIAKRVASYKKTGRKISDLEPKLLKKVNINKDGCWVWIGAKFRKKYGDYGQLRIGRRGDNKLYRAHRLSYELYKSSIPKGLELDHLCKNTLCINPDHLEAITHSENMRRGLRGIFMTARES